MAGTLVEHYRAREAQERRLAEEANSPAARAAHLELAELFGERAERLAEELRPPDGAESGS